MSIDTLYYSGILIGLASFLITGICHPLVIKLEYHYGKKSWWWLVIPGIFFLILSLYANTLNSILLGVSGFAMFWSSIEILKQHTRVILGRAKKNPNRNYE